jgi:hypothetical protein
LKDDDCTVLLFRPNGTGTTVAFTEKLCAPFRVLRGITGSFFGGSGPAPWPEMSLPNIGGAMFGSLSRLVGRRRHA